MLALTASGVKMQVVKLNVPAEPTLTYEAGGYPVDLKTVTNMSVIIGILVIDSKVGKHFKYDAVNKKLQQFDDAGAEELTALANANFPISLLVIGA